MFSSRCFLAVARGTDVQASAYCMKEARIDGPWFICNPDHKLTKPMRIIIREEEIPPPKNIECHLKFARAVYLGDEDLTDLELQDSKIKFDESVNNPDLLMRDIEQGLTPAQIQFRNPVLARRMGSRNIDDWYNKLVPLLKKGITHKDIDQQLSIPFKYEPDKMTIRKLSVYYIWGDPETGKTKKTTNMINRSHPGDYYVLGKGNYGNVWFDGYTDQKCLFIDEFDGKLPYKLMLQMTGGQEMSLPRKGLPAVKPSWDTVYILSNQSPDSHYTSERMRDTNNGEAAKDPWLRRINVILNCVKVNTMVNGVIEKKTKVKVQMNQATSLTEDDIIYESELDYNEYKVYNEGEKFKTDEELLKMFI